MKIAIPENLLKYEELAKKKSSELLNSVDLVTMLLGRTKTTDVNKELHLMYNPHMSPVTININSFVSSKDIYQLYPLQFVVEPKSFQLFMVFCTKEYPLEISQNALNFAVVSKIEQKLIDLQKKYNVETDKIERFIPEPLEQISSQNIDTSKTILLNQEQAKSIEEKKDFVKLNSKNQQNVQMEIIEFKEKNENILISISFTNKTETNYVLSKLKLKMADGNLTKILLIEQTVDVKQNSYKSITFEVPRSELDGLDLGKLFIKIVY
ncbi:MAG: hypothetical protein ACRCUP_06975 [Mycoplasmatales bacterium]